MNEGRHLDEIAEWLDALYLRLQSAEIMFAMDDLKGDDYRESLRDNLDMAIQMGVAIGRTMEHCSMLFEQLASSAVPNELLAKARSEINTLAIAARQLAFTPPEPSTDPWALHCEAMEADGATHRDTAKAWKVAHPEETKTIEQLTKASDNYRSKRNRQRKAAENPP